MTGIPPNQEDTGPLRTAAKAAIERVGWSWPSVFDEHYPPTEPGGLVYRLTSVKYVSSPLISGTVVEHVVLVVNNTWSSSTNLSLQPLSKDTLFQSYLTPFLC